MEEHSYAVFRAKTQYLFLCRPRNTWKKVQEKKRGIFRMDTALYGSK